MIKILLYAAVFLSAYGGVERFRRWSQKRRILDVPNERSSHTEPTPRGGGLIVGTICLGVFSLYCLIFRVNYAWSYVTGATLIIAVSWLDDLYTVAVGWRFLCHGVAAILVVWSLGYWETIELPNGAAFDLGRLGIFVTFFWVVWMINAYNFMDGIDGIAAVQAVAAGIGWLLCGFLLKLETTSFYAGVIAFSSLGFLVHNWHPAKIFMGDAGSAFLGYSFAALPLLARNEPGIESFIPPLLPLIAAALCWLFLFDTIVTFSRRAVKGEKIWQAHRGHLYQKLSIGGYTHRAVSILYGAATVSTVVFLIYAVRQNENPAGGLILLAILQSLVVVSIFYFSKSETI